MKIRTGFVSNSSSSSFCIYGICKDFSEILDAIPRETLYEKLSEDFEETIENEEQLNKLVEEEGEYEILETLIPYDSKDLDYYIPYDDYDSVYIGMSWSSVKDDETGAEFKERVRNLIEEKFGISEDFNTFEEAWHG